MEHLDPHRPVLPYAHPHCPHKQTGHFSSSAAVIGKKIDLCSEDMAPVQHRRITWFNDTMTFSADNLLSALSAAGAASVPEVGSHTETLSEVL